MRPAPNLIPLEVHGFGTPNLESLASYFHRTRHVNIGGTGVWLSKINQPQPVHDIKLLQHGYQKNGLVVDWLIKNGAPHSVRFLGTSLEPAFTSGSFRTRRAWCGLCISEDPGIEKALWTYAEYEVCHIHRSRLTTSCEACGWEPKFASSHNHSPGSCDNCFEQLSGHLEQSPIHDWSLFCSNQIAELQGRYQENGRSGSLLDRRFTALSAPSPAVGAALYFAWLTGIHVSTGINNGQPKPELPEDVVPKKIQNCVWKHASDARALMPAYHARKRAINLISKRKSLSMKQGG